MKKLFLLATFICIKYIAIAQIPSAGLVAYYPFCGNAKDASGNGRDLTIYGGANLHTDRHGLGNAAYQFNGVDGMLYRDTLFPGTGDLTFNLWINAYTTQNSLVIYNGNSNSNGYGMVINDGFGGTGNDLSILFGGISDVATTPITLNQWHFITMRKTGSTFDLFLDTVIFASTSSTTFSSPVGKFHMGLDYTDSTNPFNGLMDDVALYNRALTNREIGQIYLTTCPAGTLFTGQPITKTDTAGKTVTFTASTTTYVPYYQWQKKVGAGAWTNLTNTSPYSGVNTNNLVISPIATALNGVEYRCILTNGICCSDTSDPATLNVIPTGIKNISNKSVISIYPNPAHDKIVVDINTNSTGTLLVLNNLGQTCRQQQITGNITTIDINSLPVGMYIIKLQIDGEIQYSKMVKQ